MPQLFKLKAWPKLPASAKIWAVYIIAAGGIGYFLFSNFYVYSPDAGQLGGPVIGLNAEQSRLFYATRETFKHDFTPEEGLGPIFNGRSCYECHGKPGKSGGEGRDVTSTGVVRIANRVPGSAKSKRPLEEVITSLTQDDVDRLFNSGGPAIGRKSITSEFPDKYPPDCIVEIGTVPVNTELISLRHSPPVFGFGLIEAIADADIAQNVFTQLQIDKDLAGRIASQSDPLTEHLRVGRFGWKNQFPNLMLFTAEALRTEHGITTYIQPFEKFALAEQQYPANIRKFLPPEPNDTGSFINKLSFHQALLAPPPRGPITKQVLAGQKVFDRLQCAVCHTPVMYTAPYVELVHPDSPSPNLVYMEVKALENQPVRAYSDFLLHQMGVELADGVPQNGAKGGEWRTTPLWGLRLKKFYLHDGRTTDLTAAIVAHGGQGRKVTERFKRLPAKQKEELLAFLKSL